MQEQLVGRRGVHLDLKGLPPTFGRLMKLLEIIKAVGFNCVLAEWEDSWPWEVDERFRSETAYSVEEVKEFHRRAKELGIEVIPLVQSLGHMETPLRLADYRGLREVAERCDVINPLAAGARELVGKMVDDVLRYSGDVKHFHLGGDEAWTFGAHPETKAFIEKHGKGALYLHHVEPLLDALNGHGIRPILWHDMMHEWEDAALKRIAGKADLMFWSYQGHPDDSKRGAFGTATMERFTKAGIKLWGAGAYKGADSAGDADVPNMDRRAANMMAWADLARRFNLQGVVATAWSRYSTHRVQNEPIDGALDVLVQAGAVLRGRETMSNDACEKVLEDIGELERFRACRAALAKLSDARKETWQGILMCKQQLACENMDERRRGSGVFASLLRTARVKMKQTEGAASEVRWALQGLVEKIWIERYLAERMEPLWGDLAELSRGTGATPAV